MKKLKICLLEFDLSAFGGRHIEVIDGFLDTFRELGHDVTLVGCWTNKLLQSEGELTEKIMSKLDLDDIKIFDWRKLPSGERVPSSQFVDFFNGFDLIFSCAHYHGLWRYIKTPIIYWVIAKPTVRVLSGLNNLKLPSRVHIWTETQHQKNEIEIPNAKVVYSPLDCSMFRKNAKPWSQREIDILLVTAITKWKIDRYVLDKELEYIDRIGKKMNLRVVGLFTYRKKRDYEKEIIDNLSFEKYINVSRREVPKFMGNSKIFFHPSPFECAALVHYEALNSGCYPVVRLAGSAREQLGNVGIIYNELPNLGFWQWIKEDILTMNYNIKWSIKQGLRFDRKTNKDKIKKLLRQVMRENNNDIS